MMVEVIEMRRRLRMDAEYKIITSPLSLKFTRDGMTIDIQIYRGEKDPVWVLEVIDSAGGSTVWDETFQIEQDALNEVFQTIARGGIGCFLQDQIQKLH
jgi:hypothetical protein